MNAVQQIPTSRKRGGARNALSPEQERLVVENYTRLSHTELAVLARCSIGHVCSIGRRYGLRKNNRTYDKLTDEQILDLRNAYEGGEDMHEFCLDMGISIHTAKRYAHIFHWQRPPVGYKCPLETQKVLVEAYKKGFPTTLLSEQFGLSRQGVMNTLARHGIAVSRDEKRYVYDMARRLLKQFAAGKRDCFSIDESA